MNTKISEKQNQVNKTERVYKDEARFPGKSYFLIVATTFVLLIAFLISFAVVLLKSSSPDFSSDDDGDNNSVGDKSYTSVDGNLPGKTKARRESYLSKTSSDVDYVTDAIDADNAILVDLDNFQSIVEKGADKKIYPASMTKVMSLLIVCENLQSLGKQFTIDKKTVDYAYSVGGSLFGVEVGTVVTAQDLLYLTSYWSDTVAIITLAEDIAGSEEKFVELMNKKAQDLGLKGTHFDNCTGLYSKDNYTTCREMAAIFAYALENPLCNELLTNTDPYKIYDSEDNEKSLYTLWAPSWYRQRVANKPKLNKVTVIGGKTGHIDESGFCAVTYAERNATGKKYIQVLVGHDRKIVDEKNKVWRSEDLKYIYNEYVK